MSRARPGHTVRSLYLRTQAELGEFADRLQLAVFDGDGFAENESLVLRARMPYITLMRGASVIYLLTYGTRGESTRRRISVAGLGVASILASRAEIKSLAKSARRHALPRLIRDVTETTATSFMASAYTSASVSGAPLATELGFRMGPPATLLLVPHLLGAAVGRKASRQPMTFDQLVYLAIGLAGGVGIRHVEAQRVRQHRRVVDESRSAARLAGEAAGRRSVAFHKLATHDADLPGDTPHECIGNSRIALNEPTREGPLRQMLTNRRAQLWEENSALSLDLVLRRYCASRNRERPGGRLADFLSFEFDGFAAARILRPHQQRALVEGLDELQLVGEHRAFESARGLAGQSVHLRFTSSTGDRFLVLPPPEARWSFRIADPVPAAAALGVLWALAQVTTAADALPLRAALPGVGAMTALTMAATVLSRPGDAKTAAFVDWFALAASGVQVAGATPTARRAALRPDGTPRLPIQHALLAPALIGGYSWTDLNRNQKASLATAAAALTIVGSVMLRRPRPLRLIAVNFAGANAAAWVGGRAYRRQIDLDLEREMTLIRGAAEQAEQSGWDTGALKEWALVHAAATEALRSVKHDLPQGARDRYRRALRLTRRVASDELRRLSDAP